MKKAPFILVVFLFSIFSDAPADMLHLKSGGKIKGIIEQETEDAVTIAVNIGTLTYPKSEIESVLKATAEENTKLKEEWKEQKPPEEKPKEAISFKLIDTITFRDETDKQTYRYAVRVDRL